MLIVSSDNTIVSKEHSNHGLRYIICISISDGNVPNNVDKH